MQSSYRIIKSSKIEDRAIIAPPILEKIYSKFSLSNIDEPSDNQVNLEDVYKSIEAQARQEAVLIIDEAKSAADEIIKKAEACSNELNKKAMDEGYQEGYGAGYKSGYEYGLTEVEKDTAETKMQAQQLLYNCHTESRNYIKKCEREIIDLSIAIARQILKTELTINPDAIFKIAEGVISAAVDKKQIILKVSPQDFTIVKNRKDELSIYVEDSNNIIIVADPSLPQGSIRAESPSGFIDGTLEAQMNEIIKRLTEV